MKAARKMMSTSGKQAISRRRQKVRLINFNDTIIEGYVFLAYNQRVSDLLNDDRDFLPVATDAGEMRVMSKRAIMEIEVIEDDSERNRRKEDRSEEVVQLMSGNAYDILGAQQNADDATIRAIYLDKIASVDPTKVLEAFNNSELAQAAEQLANRYSTAYDAITHTRQIEAIAEAVKATQPKRRRFGD
ncbi:MAG: hypothetical protein AAGJ73_15645 [Pseudomonadota bacterium]